MVLNCYCCGIRLLLLWYLIAIVLVLDCYCFGIQLLLLWYLIAIVVVFDSNYYGIRWLLQSPVNICLIPFSEQTKSELNVINNNNYNIPRISFKLFTDCNMITSIVCTDGHQSLQEELNLRSGQSHHMQRVSDRHFHQLISD